MDTALLIAIVAGVTAMITGVFSFLSPYLLARQIATNARQARMEDWARQDEVASKVAEAAQNLSDRQDASAAKAEEAAIALVAADAKRERDSKVTNTKLDVIHTLVNSNMTAAMQSELDATNVSLALMLELSDIKLAAGQKPTDAAKSVITVTKAKIKELSAQLQDRMEQAKIVAAQEDRSPVPAGKGEV